MSVSEFSITNFRSVERGDWIGVFTVEFDNGLIIHNCRLIKGRDKCSVVTGPQVNGHQVVELPEEWQVSIATLAMSEHIVIQARRGRK